MMTEAVGNVCGNGFFKHPGIIVFGALPFDKDYKSKQGQYFIKDLYMLNSMTSISSSGYPTNTYYQGVLFYNEFLEKYCLYTVSSSSYNQILDCYPTISMKVNPFVNGETGYCCFTNGNFPGGGSAHGNKIFLNPNNGYLEYGPSINVIQREGYCGQGQIHDYSYTTTALIKQSYTSNYMYYYRSEKTWDEYLAEAKTTTDSSVYIKFLQVDNASPLTTTMSFTHKRMTTMVRQDFLPDLDHEKDNNIPEICGIYMTENNKANKYGGIGVGSLVFEDKNNTDYNYVGVLVQNNDVNYVNKSKVVEEKDEEGNVISTQTYRWRYYIMGVNCAGEKTRKIVLLSSINFTDDNHKAGRFYIIEDGDDPIESKKFWYNDNYSTSNYYLFHTGDGSNIPEITFNYVDLREDDEKEIESDIVLTPKGMSRINPWNLMFNINQSPEITTKNIYVSNWLTPAVNII